MGRLINHGKGRHANVVPKIVEFNAKPEIVFFAKKNINLGDELLYDYGERRPEVIFENKFLKWFAPFAVVIQQLITQIYIYFLAKNTFSGILF